MISIKMISTGYLMKLRSATMHNNCRNKEYPGSSGSIIRYPVPNDKISWKEPYSEYNPPTYTAIDVLGKPWADPEIGSKGFHPENEWNNDKGPVNRTCGSHKYEIDKDGFPINPVGRTGLKGRGLLGRWGPNHAGDAIVTRWKRFNTNIALNNKKKPILEFVAIKRKDCGMWALPGGFAEPNETLLNTIKREFFEEVLSDGLSHIEKDKMESKVKELDNFFQAGDVIHDGYVDDARNTDQAWITSLVVNFHDDNYLFNDVLFKGGDDAEYASWLEINQYLTLYANHKHFIHDVAFKHNAAYF